MKMIDFLYNRKVRKRILLQTKSLKLLHNVKAIIIVNKKRKLFHRYRTD